MAHSRDDPGGRLDALKQVKSQLEAWNPGPGSPTGYVIENIPAGHPLHSAVVSLESFYPHGGLPRPARVYWWKLLKHARHGEDDDTEPAEEAAERLLEWVQQETDTASSESAAATPKRALGDAERKGKRAGKTGGGRKPDPEIAKRNERAVRMFKDGTTVDDVCKRLGISADLARKIKSEAGLGGKGKRKS